MNLREDNMQGIRVRTIESRNATTVYPRAQDNTVLPFHSYMIGARINDFMLNFLYLASLRSCPNHLRKTS